MKVQELIKQLQEVAGDDDLEVILFVDERDAVFEVNDPLILRGWRYGDFIYEDANHLRECDINSSEAEEVIAFQYNEG